MKTIIKMDLIKELLKKEKKLHFTLIDPENQSPKEAGQRAEICYEYGTNAIMIGGSTVDDRELVYRTVESIKRSVDIPTILFPNSSRAVSENADYIFFMMLMNSIDRRFLIEEQIKGASLINEWNIKPISMGYIVISTSRKPTMVERVCNLDRIEGNEIQKAINYALTAQYLNMQCIYLEAGSGAEKPVPNEMISAVRAEIEIPIIVGGGIGDGKTAREKTRAGADVIVNGTATEEDCSKIKEIIESIK